MTIPNLKDLGKVIDLCRKKGVSAIQLGEIRIELGNEPIEKNSRNQDTPEVDPTNPWANFPAGELTPEQLMFYSSGGLPENDPAIKDEQ